MVITYAIGFNLKVSNRSEWIRVIGVIICAVWLLKKLETPGYIATSIIGLSVIPSHVLMVKSSQISPDLPNSRKFLTSLADRSRTTYMETIGETWKSEMSEMRKKKRYHHDITILLGPEKNYPCQKELHISRRLLKHPMTPIPWLKLPFCLQMKILFPPQARPFFWCLTVVPTRFSTPRTSRASLRTGKSSPRTGDSWSLEAMITGDVASHWT